MYQRGFDDALRGIQDQTCWASPKYRDGWFAGAYNANVI